MKTLRIPAPEGDAVRVAVPPDDLRQVQHKVVVEDRLQVVQPGQEVACGTGACPGHILVTGAVPCVGIAADNPPSHHLCSGAEGQTEGTRVDSILLTTWQQTRGFTSTAAQALDGMQAGHRKLQTLGVSSWRGRTAGAPRHRHPVGRRVGEGLEQGARRGRARRAASSAAPRPPPSSRSRPGPRSCSAAGRTHRVYLCTCQLSPRPLPATSSIQPGGFAAGLLICLPYRCAQQ